MATNQNDSKRKEERWIIRNKKTGQTARVSAKNYAEACRKLGWKPTECTGVLIGKVDFGLPVLHYVSPDQDNPLNG